MLSLSSFSNMATFVIKKCILITEASILEEFEVQCPDQQVLINKLPKQISDILFLSCRYKLELVGHGRKLTWEAKPRSIHEGIASVISSNDCLIFETAMAQHFGENGNLAINVTIYKAYY